MVGMLYQGGAANLIEPVVSAATSLSVATSAVIRRERMRRKRKRRGRTRR